jgi:hypothetical protein
MENAWQFAKIYPSQVDSSRLPTDEYHVWRKAGFANDRAIRYPMGKGARPLGLLLGNDLIGYIEARSRVYFRLYRDCVRETTAFRRLQSMHDAGEPLTLFDFDGYDHDAIGMSLGDVLHEPQRKMGHAFVLKAMLLFGAEVDPADLPRHGQRANRTASLI